MTVRIVVADIMWRGPNGEPFMLGSFRPDGSRCAPGEEGDGEPGADGCVRYSLLRPDGSVLTNLMQPFARDGPKKRPGATPDEIANDRANIWAWDGNREAPSLSPSYLLRGGPGGTYPDLPRVHLYLRAGKIDLCDDSNGVVVGP